jgi:hypothetical protein
MTGNRPELPGFSRGFEIVNQGASAALAALGIQEEITRLATEVKDRDRVDL